MASPSESRRPGGLHTPRASRLGLDTLAKRKRAAALERASGNGSRKKFRTDDGDESFFKGMVSTILFWSIIYRNLHSPYYSGL